MPSQTKHQSSDAKNFGFGQDWHRVSQRAKALLNPTSFKHRKPQSQSCRHHMNEYKLSHFEKLLGLTSEQAAARKREWNRSHVEDFFPRIPPTALERVLDILFEKRVLYNLSESQRWNARRFNGIAVAHVRHEYSDYDKLLREEHVERFEARKRTAEKVWKVLKEWCPWESSNDVLERCFRITLLRPEERPNGWDPMDVDSEDEFVDAIVPTTTAAAAAAAAAANNAIPAATDDGDPMDLD